MNSGGWPGFRQSRGIGGESGGLLVNHYYLSSVSLFLGSCGGILVRRGKWMVCRYFLLNESCMYNIISLKRMILGVFDLEANLDM